jgi:hypothetical protein
MKPSFVGKAFADYLELTKDPTAAAVLCLAHAVERLREDMGGDLLVSQSLTEISNSIDAAADTIERLWIHSHG